MPIVIRWPSRQTAFRELLEGGMIAANVVCTSRFGPSSLDDRTLAITALAGAGMGRIVGSIQYSVLEREPRGRCWRNSRKLWAHSLDVVLSLGVCILGLTIRSSRRPSESQGLFALCFAMIGHGVVWVIDKHVLCCPEPREGIPYNRFQNPVGESEGRLERREGEPPPLAEQEGAMAFPIAPGGPSIEGRASAEV